MSDALPTDTELLRKAAFVPCKSKEALGRWVKRYLGWDLPNCVVYPESNSSPLDYLWEVYSHAKLNDDPEFSRVLTYAARDSLKTLTASIMEVLAIVHLGRSVAHMAAIESQAKKAQSYVKKFLSRPILRDYVVGDNQRNVRFVRYQHKQSGESVTQKQWEEMPTGLKDEYEEHDNYIAIVICTMQGANSEHVPFFVVDEVDVVSNPAAYEEAKAIPSEFGDKMPITILTSSRKFSFGLVQNEIDKAAKTGLHIRHWNLIDVTRPCPATRHLPLLDKVPIYRSDETLESISASDWEALPKEVQDKYVKDEGFQGCLQNCKIFAACRGRLATHQKSESQLLKSVHYTQRRFMESSLEFAKAQLLCWKPSSAGTIYPNFDPEVHLITAAQMAEMITGEPYVKNKPRMTKAELEALFRHRQMPFGTGMDFGMTHCFSAVTGAKDQQRLFIFNVHTVPGLEIGQMIDLCEKVVKPYSPAVWPDTAYPAYIKLLKRHGYSVREWVKGPGSVVAGIEIVRYKLRPAVGAAPTLFLLRGDEGCEALALSMSKYHWKLDQAGRPTDEPDKVDDDDCDAMRYLVMNMFPADRSKISIGTNPQAAVQPVAMPMALPALHPQNWMKQVIAEHTGQTYDPFDPNAEAPYEPGQNSGKKGGFCWSF